MNDGAVTKAVNQIKGDLPVIGVLRWLLMGAVLLSGLPAGAAEPSAPESIALVMHRSGLREQVVEIAAMIQVQIRAQLNAPRNRATGLSPEQRKRLISSVDAAFATDTLLGYIEGELAASLSETATGEVLAWLESDAGRRISLREAEASTELAPPGKVRDAIEVMVPSTAARSDRYQRLSAATYRVDGQAQIALGIVAGTSYVLASALAGQEAATPDLDAIRTNLEFRRSSLAASLGKAIGTLMAVTYESVSDADLDAYVVFAESSSGLVFHKTMVLGIDHALYQAFKESMRLFAEISRSQPTRPVESQQTPVLE